MSNQENKPMSTETKNRTGEEITALYLNPSVCPLCRSSVSLNRIKGTPGDWVRNYRCMECLSIIEFNEGDKMGGQFDQITILEDNFNSTSGSQLTENK